MSSNPSSSIPWAERLPIALLFTAIAGLRMRRNEALQKAQSNTVQLFILTIALSLSLVVGQPG